MRRTAISSEEQLAAALVLIHEMEGTESVMQFIADRRLDRARCLELLSCELTGAKGLSADASREPIAVGRGVFYVRNAHGNLKVAIEGQPVRRFNDYPLGTRVEARLRFFFNGTHEEHEKLNAARELSREQRAAVWDEVLSTRAAAVHAEFVAEDERAELERQAYAQDPGKGQLDRKLKSLLRKKSRERSL